MASLLCAFDPTAAGILTYWDFIRRVKDAARDHPRLPSSSETPAPGVLRPRQCWGHSPIPLDSTPLPPRYSRSGTSASQPLSVKQQMHDVGVAPVLASLQYDSPRVSTWFFCRLLRLHNATIWNTGQREGDEAAVSSVVLATLRMHSEPSLSIGRAALSPPLYVVTATLMFWHAGSGRTLWTARGCQLAVARLPNAPTHRSRLTLGHT